MKIWWLSFADGNRPAGTQFLGVVLTQAISAEAAIQKAWALGINPGGEVLFSEYSSPVSAQWLDRLLTRDELQAATGPLMTIAEVADELERLEKT